MGKLVNASTRETDQGFRNTSDFAGWEGFVPGGC